MMDLIDSAFVKILEALGRWKDEKINLPEPSEMKYCDDCHQLIICECGTCHCDGYCALRKNEQT